MTEYITVAADDRVEARNGVIKLHGPEGFEGMRRAGRLAAEILDALVPHVVPGVTTGDSTTSSASICSGGGVPATLGYRGYTKSCCISINHVVCHGIPGDKHSEGRRHRQHRRHPDARRLARRHQPHVFGRRRAAQGAQAGRRHLRMPDARARAGEARQPARRHRPRDPEPCRKHRYSVVRDFCGHGLGRLFHDSPEVVHAGRPGTGPSSSPACSSPSSR